MLFPVTASKSLNIIYFIPHTHFSKICALIRHCDEACADQFGAFDKKELISTEGAS
jgi:hypothetical protein